MRSRTEEGTGLPAEGGLFAMAGRSFASANSLLTLSPVGEIPEAIAALNTMPIAVVERGIVPNGIQLWSSGVLRRGRRRVPLKPHLAGGL